MNTIILAGGYANRMIPTTNEVPKHLLPVAGRPILSYVLDSLETLYTKTEGRCYLSVNKKFEENFRKFIGDSKTNVPLELMVEDTTSKEQKLGVLGALNLVQEKIDVPLEGGVLVIGGDNIFSLDIVEFVEYQKQYSKRSLVALYDIQDTEKTKFYGVAKLDDGKDPLGKKIIDFKEKPTKPNSTLVSKLIHIFRAEDLAMIGSYIAESNNTDAIGNYIIWLMSNEKKTELKDDVVHTSGVNGFVFDGYWFDINTYESFEEANRFFKEKQ